MPSDQRQLEISFERDPLISTLLNSGSFAVFAELSPYGGDSQQEGGVSPRAAEFAAALEAARGGRGLAFLARLSRTASVRQLRAVRTLASAPFLFCLTGASATPRHLQEDAANARTAGYCNFLATTGRLRRSEDGQVVPYVDSVEILDALADPHKSQTLAACVTPFVYTPEAQCAQYAKLLRKLAHGAQFIIAQAGWDMAKYQEMQWFLQQRELVVPIVVRLRFVTPEEAGRLRGGLEPGVAVPLSVAARLERLQSQPGEFRAYQRELAALMAVGCRKLGYSGILLSGLEDGVEATAFLETLARLEGEVESFDGWLTRWEAFTAGGSMIPATRRALEAPFYLFSNLLTRELPFYDRQASRFTRQSVSEPPWLESFRASLFAPGARGALPRLARTLFPRCAERSRSYGLDVSACPKRLTGGACCGVQPDGLCEDGQRACLYGLLAQLAVSRNELYLLED